MSLNVFKSNVTASLVAQLVKHRPSVNGFPFYSWVRTIPWRSDRLPTPVFSGSPGGAAGKDLPTVWEAGVLFLGWEDSLEEGMATHSSILVWRILWTVQSMGLQRVTHMTESLSLFS